MNAIKLNHRLSAIIIGIGMGVASYSIPSNTGPLFVLIYSMVLGGLVCYYIMRMQDVAYFQDDKVEIKLEKVKGQWDR